MKGEEDEKWYPKVSTKTVFYSMVSSNTDYSLLVKGGMIFEGAVRNMSNIFRGFILPFTIEQRIENI